MVPVLLLTASTVYCDNTPVLDQVPSLAFTESALGTAAGRFGLVARSGFTANADQRQAETAFAVFAAPIDRVTLSMGLQSGWSSQGTQQTRRVGPDARLSIRLLGDRQSTFVLALFGGHRALPFAQAASVDGNVAVSVRLGTLRYDLDYGLAHQRTTEVTEHVVSLRAVGEVARWFQLGAEAQYRKATRGSDRFVTAGVQATVAGPVFAASLTLGMADRRTEATSAWAPFVGVTFADVF